MSRFFAPAQLSVDDMRIANRALRLVRTPAITSFSDNTKVSNLCLTVYPDVRDDVLSCYPWNCTIMRASLPQLMETPAYGFSAQYAIPADCLRVWQVEGDPVWKREGRRLLTDAAQPIYILYIALVTGEFIDAWVAKVIAARMAAEISPVVTDNASLTDALMKMAEVEFSRAKRMDAQEGTPDEVVEQGDWLDSRR